MDGNANKQGKGKGWREGWRWQLEWRVTKRAMATATKRVMATDGDSTGNGYGKEGGGRLTAVTMGTAQRTHLLATTGERGMMVATGHGLCVCFGVCGETTKNKEENKIHHLPVHIFFLVMDRRAADRPRLKRILILRGTGHAPSPWKLP
jgi:hypothetical protein